MRIWTNVSLALALVSFMASNGLSFEEEVGSIKVDSEPAGAAVYVEGFLAGVTPLTVENLPPGSYRVVLKSPSRGDNYGDVVVAEGEESTFSAVLPATGPRSPVRSGEDWTPVVGKDARKPYEKAKASKKLREYEVLEIGNFLVKSEKPLPADRAYTIFGDLSRELDKRTEFRQFVTNYTQAPSERWKLKGDPTAPTLVLSGVITEYEPGSQTKRYMIGFGAGKTRAYCLFPCILLVPPGGQVNGGSRFRTNGERLHLVGYVRRQGRRGDEGDR
jgi:hypothetical protein